MKYNIKNSKKISLKTIIKDFTDTYEEGKFIEKDEILLLDKKIYDKCHLTDAGIEFGSVEFYQWKERNKYLYFPCLDAPWQVRKAWSALEEKITKEENKKVFISLENNIHFNTTKINGLFCSLRLKTINDYKNLLDIAVNTYKDIYKLSLNNIYKEYIKILSK